MPSLWHICVMVIQRKFVAGKASWSRLYRSNHYLEKSGGVLTKERYKLIVSQPCYYCGDPPRLVNPYGLTYEDCCKKQRQYYSPEWYAGGWVAAHGIDKIKPAPDYSDLSNLCSCCWVCNKMKGILGRDVFLAHIEKIHRKQCAEKIIKENCACMEIHTCGLY